MMTDIKYLCLLDKREKERESERETHTHRELMGEGVSVNG